MNISLHVDPISIQQCVTLTKDIITIIATIAAAVIAYAGLTAWRQQLRGKTEYDLARRLLRGVYKVRDAVQAVRAPFVSAAEAAQAMREADIEIERYNPSDPEHRAQSQRAVYQRRWGYIREAFSELDVDALEAEVVWGQTIAKLLEPLREHVLDLNINIGLYLDGLSQPSLSASLKEDTDPRRVVFRAGGKNDAYATRLEEIVGNVQNYLRPHLKL